MTVKEQFNVLLVLRDFWQRSGQKLAFSFAIQKSNDLSLKILLLHSLNISLPTNALIVCHLF